MENEAIIKTPQAEDLAIFLKNNCEQETLSKDK